MYIAKHDCTLSTPTLWYLTMQALFAVFASEEVYLRDLDTLVDHYMCDSGLDPSLPKEQRVLSSQEHHHIFSNIKEIAYISRGYCWHVVHLHVWGSVCYTASPSQLAMEHRNPPVFKYIFILMWLYLFRLLKELQHRQTESILVDSISDILLLCVSLHSKITE